MYGLIPSLILLLGVSIIQRSVEGMDVARSLPNRNRGDFNGTASDTTSSTSCPHQSHPAKHNSSLGSPCNYTFYQHYGLQFQFAFYTWALHLGRPPNDNISDADFVAHLLEPIMPLYSEEDCQYSVSSQICNSQSNYVNEPLQCRQDTGMCECLRFEKLGIFTTELSTTRCLGEEGSLCLDNKGDPNLDQESREVGLYCGFGNKCVENHCRRQSTPSDTTSPSSCPVQSHPAKYNSSLGSPCNYTFYQTYGLPFQTAFYTWALHPDRPSNDNISDSAFVATLLEPIMSIFSEEDCEFSVSSLICNSQSNYLNEPLQCRQDTGMCECLRLEDLGIFTTELSTARCLGEEGSLCWDKGDPNLEQESREVGLLCGFGNECVDNHCRRPTPTTTLSSISTSGSTTATTSDSSTSSSSSCPLQSNPSKYNSSRGSPCNYTFYQHYGVPFQTAFYTWALHPERSSNDTLSDSAFVATLLQQIMPIYSQEECEYSVSSLICNSQSNYFNEPLQCRQDTERCECLKSKELGIFTTREMGTTGCVGKEGSLCWDKGDPNLVQESREVGLLCGFGNKCVENHCRRPGWRKTVAKSNAFSVQKAKLVFLSLITILVNIEP